MENQIQTDNFSLTGLTSGSVKNAMKSIGATSRDLWYVPINDIIQLPDFNVRVKNDEYKSAVRAIADSIKANGFYPHKPIACMVIKQDGKDILAVIDGHTRQDGALLAISEGCPLEKLPVVTTGPGMTLEDAVAGLKINNSQNPLTPMALGIICKRLVSFGWTHAKIAEKLVFTVAYVGQLLQLVGAEKAIRDMVNDGQLSATEAVQTIREEGENALKVLQNAQELANKNGKPRITRKYIRKVKEPVAPVNPTPEPSNTDQKEPLQVVPTPVEPLHKTDSVTPYDALVIGEAVARSEQKGMSEAIAWLKANPGIADFSHYELIHAIFPGTTVSDLRDMVN